MSYFGAMALGVITYLVGSYRAEMRDKEDLASKVVGDHIVVRDVNCETVELSDIDGDGDYDSLEIYSRDFMPSRYMDRMPVQIYIKPGFLSRSSDKMEVHIVDEGEFNSFIELNNVPMPGSSLLNEETMGMHNSHVFWSHSGLLKPNFKIKE